MAPLSSNLDQDIASPRSPGTTGNVRFSLESHARNSADEQFLSLHNPGKRPANIDTTTNILSESVSTSPTSLQDSQPVNTGSSSVLPTPTPRPRNRGYSLRRSLFAQNAQKSLGDKGVIIEMEPSESLRGANNLLQVPSHGEKPKSSSSITVSSKLKDSQPELCSQFLQPENEHIRSWSLTYWLSRHLPPFTISGRVTRLLETTRKTILRIHDIPPSEDGRHIDLVLSRTEHLLDERTNKPHVPNTIRSSRYTLVNFFPRQFIAQFSKLANFYFLCISILQLIPGLSTTGTFTTIVPLMIFVGLSMAKEGHDDLRRYRLDKEENRREVHLLIHLPQQEPQTQERGLLLSSSEVWHRRQWQSLKVGDIIRIDRDEPIPADIVLLDARGAEKIAYIETMALDGETNLKSKRSLPQLAHHCQTSTRVLSSKITFVVEDPNLDLYKFEGKVMVENETIPLTNNEIIYRGSVLRNTEAVYGMVIYTGEECKIRMNANKNPRIKAPALQSIVNRVVILIVIFVITLSIFLTIAYQLWRDPTEEKSWYLSNARVPFGPSFTAFIIMFNTMIPLSLYVSMEIVKICQMFLLNDIDMYDEESDTPLEARTSTINEELGQVSYIFSDKTGTLTNNSMRFRKLCVSGTAWLHDRDLRDEDAAQHDKQRLTHKKRSVKGKKIAARKSTASEAGVMRRKSTLTASNVPTAPRPPQSHHHHLGQPTNPPLGGHITRMLDYIQRRPNTLFARKARFLLLSLAICHTCVPERHDDDNITFQAASPDELALVSAAQEFGYAVVDRQVGTITVKTFPAGDDGEQVYETYEILDVIEFSSTRKRMSIIVRMPDQRICIFCKGADSILTKLLRLSDLAVSKASEVERRLHQRKSLEAGEAMRRRSEHQNWKYSASRISMGNDRTSLGGLPNRKSTGGGRKVSLRDGIDQWLKERETDVSVSQSRESSQFYSPRPSAQYGPHLFESPRASIQVGGRPSAGFLDQRLSLQFEETDELVEESLAVNDGIVFERCFQHINDFATDGLRTLMYCHRFVNENRYQRWKEIYLEATTSLVDRQTRIEKAAELIECDFELTGATAIEDKLQRGVPEAIEKLRRANIKLWMLTGDKRETAINIGHSCHLVKPYSAVILLDHEDDVQQIMAENIRDIRLGKVAHSVIVIDGQTLSAIEMDPAINELFIELAILANSVICCRASPSQKALLVKAIRHRVKHSVTLAIGDGANDIAMIQEAHVGIGITGKEGFQAARSSDYSIAQFRFLLKLLLVHGRWNYIRICKYTLGTFWKEMLFYLTQALYQRSAGYTGTSLYESWSLSMFNTLFTSLPVIFMGVFEKDLAASTLLAVPELYTKGQQNGGFNFMIYFGWTFMAACEAMIIYFTMYGVYGEAIFTKDNGLYAMGALTFTACVVIISTKMQFLEMHNKSVTALIAIILSVGGWFLWNIILAFTYSDNAIYNVKDGFLNRFGQNLLWWLTLTVVVASTVLFEITLTSIKVAIRPSDVDTFQWFEQDRDIRKRFEEAAAMELQQGWDRGAKKSSFELAREATTQAEREAQVQELLDRPRTMEEGRVNGANIRRRQSAPVVDEDGILLSENVEDSTRPRKSLDIQELFSKGFGAIRKGPDLR